MSTLVRGTSRHAWVHGLVRLEADALVLEFRAEIWQAAPSSGVVRVPLDEVVAIRWHWRGLLRRSGRIELVVRVTPSPSGR